MARREGWMFVGGAAAGERSAWGLEREVDAMVGR